MAGGHDIVQGAQSWGPRGVVHRRPGDDSDMYCRMHRSTGGISTAKAKKLTILNVISGLDGAGDGWL